MCMGSGWEKFKHRAETYPGLMSSTVPLLGASL
jgi:hypothetical protein